MGKIEAMMQGRNEGLAMALKIVKSGGVEALEEEIKHRNLTGISTKMTIQEEAVLRRQIKHEVTLAFIPLTILTLHDQFGFGKKRCLDFSERFRIKIDALSDPDAGVKWEDYVQVVKDEIGINLTFE